MMTKILFGLLGLEVIYLFYDTKATQNLICGIKTLHLPNIADFMWISFEGI